MAKYMLSVVVNVDDEMPSEDDIQEMFATVGRFNDSLQAAGKWVFAGGLEPIAASTVVDASGDKPTVTDGPFSEAKEYLGGFWIIEVDDLDEALDWAKKGSAACAGPVEVRPFNPGE